MALARATLVSAPAGALLRAGPPTGGRIYEPPRRCEQPVGVLGLLLETETSPLCVT